MSDSKKRPELYVLVGPNGSGKSTVTRRMGMDRRVRGLIVNPDLYVESLDIDDPVERWKRTFEDIGCGAGPVTCRPLTSP